MELTIDERNGKLLAELNQMRAGGVVVAGDVVEANSLGLSTGLFVAGERLFVAEVSERIGKLAGDPTRCVDLWSFDADGQLKRTVTDARFLRVVESAKPKRTAAVKPATN
jgi:hypothetical protein